MSEINIYEIDEPKTPEECIGRKLRNQMWLSANDIAVALDSLSSVKLLIHDIKEGSSDITGEYESELLEEIKEYLGL